MKINSVPLDPTNDRIHARQDCRASRRSLRNNVAANQKHQQTKTQRPLSRRCVCLVEFYLCGIKTVCQDRSRRLQAACF
ncbi:hypothetical protein C2E31_24320 [Rhodopirellula baltica]|nr:hypothetical protein C2E31_24320 [Rhodopirellula baltica]